jgi:hypothetical protein
MFGHLLYFTCLFCARASYLYTAEKQCSAAASLYIQTGKLLVSFAVLLLRWKAKKKKKK